MPIHFQKSLQECLPKIKKPTPQIGLPPAPRHTTLSSSTSWILRGCKHPKTSSFAFDDQKKESNGKQEGNDDAATLSDIDRFLLENFKSLYQKEDEIMGSPENSEDGDDEVLKNNEENDDNAGGGLIGSPRFMDPAPGNLRGSHRFFVAPGSSSSLMEEARTSLTIPCTVTSSTSEDMAGGFTRTSSSSSSCNNDSRRTSDAATKEVVLSADDFITLLTYSTNPYDDFRKSMQEMIEARLKHNGKIDWEFMEELLFCYLNLNDKKSYRFILRAFVDIIVILRENSSRIVPAKQRNVGGSNTGGSSSKGEQSIPWRNLT